MGRVKVGGILPSKVGVVIKSGFARAILVWPSVDCINAMHVYAPLMRFGDHWLSVKEGDETVLHQRYETEHHRNRAVRELKQANILKAGQALTTGKDNPERHKLYREVSPEAMLLFAKEIGMGNDAAHQAYLKLATANHSALRRMIHRKGTAGFSEDLQRVLASFVMSSARHSSHTLFNEPIMESIRQIEDADAQKQAQQMIDYANDPKEDLQKWKAVMFIWNMGASVKGVPVWDG